MQARLEDLLALLREMEEAGVRGARLVDAVAILLALRSEEIAGRPRLTRLVGVGDRRARNLISKLRSLGLVVQRPGGTSLTGRAARALEAVYMRWSSGLTCCMLPVDRDTAKRFSRNVLRVRDRLAIILADSSRLVLLIEGEGSSFTAPGAPKELAAPYVEAAGCSSADIGVYVGGVFRGERCYRCCSALLQAVLMSPEPLSS